MHPILLSQRNLIATRIIAWYHINSGHSGRNMSLNEIRCNDFWVINGNVAVRSHIFHCVTFRKLKANLESKKMEDLVEERSSDAASFTSVGVSMFGSFCY